MRFGIFAVLLAVTMPQLLRSFCPTTDLLDTSWAWMLGYAVQHHLQWGKSVIFTYGPLGFLSDSYFYPDHVLWGLTATARLTSWFVFGLGFACILRKLAPDDEPSLGKMAPVAIGWVLGASFLDLSGQSAILGALLLVLAIVKEDSAVVPLELVLSGSLLALGALIKSTALIVALFVLLVYPALWWRAGRQKSELYLSLVPLLSFFISFCGLWLLCAQSLAHLPAYIRGTWAIVSGYTPAMSVTTTPLQILSALAILALFAGVFAGVCIGGTRGRVSQCVLLGMVAFCAWKEGFTLQDPGYLRHPMSFFGTGLLIASVGIVLLSNDNPRFIRTCLYGAYAIALLSSILGYPAASLTYAHVLDNYKEYLTLISSKSRRTVEQRVQTAAIHQEIKLPNEVLGAVGSASVNVMPWSLVMAQGYHMRLIASPVMQSYSAYTPYLDQMNARQIWDGGSADKIIFTYATLGSRYPPFDEPATFRAILACYRTEYFGHPYSVLSHDACMPSKTLAADKSEEGTLGRWVLVPPKASYVALDVRSSVTGDVKNMLYKADHIFVLLGLADGETEGPFQLIYPVARDGLFIRYYIGSQSDAARLFSGDASGLRRIAGIQIVPVSGSSDYADRFGVRFFDENPTSSNGHSAVFGNARQRLKQGPAPGA